MKKRVVGRFLSVALLIILSAEGKAQPLSNQTNNSLELETIVVTAERREGSLQETPLSVAVLSGEQLNVRDISSVVDLDNHVANLDTSPFPVSQATPRLFIRGIGLLDVQITQDAPVGVYLNGAYVARSTGLALDVIDLQRVEVLRGPQGTLYGRNSVAGAINFITAAPEQEFSFTQKFNSGSRDLFGSKTTLNLPIGDNVSAKLNYVVDQQDGYLKNTGPGQDFYDRDNKAARLDLRWQASEAITVDYGFDDGRTEIANPTYQAVLPPNANDQIFGDAGVIDPNTVVDVFPNGNRAKSLSTDLPLLPTITDVSGHGLTVAWDVDNHTFKSISAYREVSSKQYADLAAGSPQYNLIDGQPLQISAASNADLGVISAFFNGQTNFSNTDARRDIEQDQLSQELQWLGDFDQWRYVTGLYYFEEDGTENLPLSFNPLFEVISGLGSGSLVFEDIAIRNQSTAVYGEATFSPDLFDNRLHFTAGLRYTEDKREAEVVRLRQPVLVNTADFTGSALPFSVLNLNGRAAREFDNTSYNLVLAYDVAEQINIYGRFATAYKSGGFNTRALIRPLAPDAFQRGFDEEEIRSFEVGLKSEWLDSRLRLNTAVFINQYDDIQLNLSINPNNPGNENATLADTDVFNGGEAEISGFEIDIDALIFPGFIASLNYGYLDADFTKIIDPRIDSTNQGFTFPNAPQHSLALNFDYQIAAWEFGTLNANLHYSFTDEKQASADLATSSTTLIDEVKLVNGAITLSDVNLGNGNLVFSLWGKNLTDEDYVTDAVAIFPHTTRAVLFGEPRSGGVAVEYHF